MKAPRFSWLQRLRRRYEGESLTDADSMAAHEDALDALTGLTKDGTVLTPTQLEHVKPEPLPRYEPDRDQEAR